MIEYLVNYVGISKSFPNVVHICGRFIITLFSWSCLRNPSKLKKKKKYFNFFLILPCAIINTTVNDTMQQFPVNSISSFFYFISEVSQYEEIEASVIKQ